MASGAPRSACRAARLALTTSRSLPARLPIRRAVPALSSARWLSSATQGPDAGAPSSEPAPAAPAETAPKSRAEAAAELEGRPRWSYTPPLAKAPFSVGRPKDPRRSVWTTNEDPAVLDRFYERLLGAQGADMLPEELKWLAVTHKSFDQGRRGFNDRLAYLGLFFFFSPPSPFPQSMKHLNLEHPLFFGHLITISSPPQRH